jgi:hypothetical protein
METHLFLLLGLQMMNNEHGQARTATPTHRPGSATPSLMTSAAPKLVLQQMNMMTILVPRCPSCLSPVFAAERVYVGNHQWHKTCLTCSTCSKLLDSSSLNDVGGGLTVYCNKCYKLAMERTRQDKRE